MAFKNRIRLPLQLHSEQFPEERNVFRKANGQAKTLLSIVRKTFELETDYMPGNWHQRLKIALSHDTVTLEGERYLGDISQDGDYTIEWPEGVLHYPTAKAGVKVQATPFDATNSNCQTCEALNQVVLENDEATGIYGALQEDQDYSVDTADNDSICCYPAVFSLVSFNSTYLTSASINPETGLFSFHTGADLTTINGLVIATYRVTCPDGSYDEADITADFEGSVPAECLAPTDVQSSGVTQVSATVDWDQPAPGGIYYWELYEGSGPVGSPVQSGTTGADVSVIPLAGLNPATEYYFQVRSVCDEVTSNFASTGFTTPSAEVSCGSYRLTNAGDEPFTVAVYMQCSGGVSGPQYIPYLSSLIVCALENTPGDYVLISASPNVTIEYLGSC